MAVILGQYNVNKQLSELNEKTAYNAKLSQLRELIELATPVCKLAEDIYDTYYHLKKVDGEFAKKLWTLLCRMKGYGGVDINSYFSWGVNIGGYVHISKYGVCIMHQSINEYLQSTYDLTQEQIYRGHAFLSDYLEDFTPKEEQLDKFISELEVFIKHFPDYAQKFFECVSQYSVPTIKD